MYTSACVWTSHAGTRPLQLPLWPSSSSTAAATAGATRIRTRQDVSCLQSISACLVAAAFSCALAQDCRMLLLPTQQWQPQRPGPGVSSTRSGFRHLVVHAKWARGDERRVSLAAVVSACATIRPRCGFAKSFRRAYKSGDRCSMVRACSASHHILGPNRTWSISGAVLLRRC